MRPTHAGAVVVRDTAGGREYLVVSSSNRKDWVLPKGHIEPDEELATTALRELEEEAGVLGELVSQLGQCRYAAGGRDIHAAFFLVRAIGSVPALEGRTLRWLPAEAARALLTFDELRSVIDQAERVMEAM